MGDFPKFGHILVIACNSICMHGPACGIGPAVSNMPG